MTNRINSILFAFASNSITLNYETNATLLLDDEKITMLMLMIADDEKNKMLPEAQSINQDGSQDGLMEAANIPLQSKEEDQMWKILNTDERCGGVCSGLKSSQLLIKFPVWKPNSLFYQILNSCDFAWKMCNGSNTLAKSCWNLRTRDWGRIGFDSHTFHFQLDSLCRRLSPMEAEIDFILIFWSLEQIFCQLTWQCLPPLLCWTKMAKKATSDSELISCQKWKTEEKTSCKTAAHCLKS